MLWQSVTSFHSPDWASLVRRHVARENLDTEIPLGVNLVSASLPRFPSRMTLLTLLDAILSCTVAHHAQAGVRFMRLYAAPQAEARERASSCGKKGETAGSARFTACRARAHEPPPPPPRSRATTRSRHQWRGVPPL